MRLSIHLFTEQAGSFDDLLDYDDTDSEQQRDQATGTPFECEVVLVSRRQDRPHWADYLEEFFTLQWSAGASSSAAVLANVDNRFFAVTFGQGRHLLNRELLVHDFGLKVAANSVPPDRLRAIGSMSLDTLARQTLQTTGTPSALRAFTLDFDTEWVRTLAGGTDDGLTRSMSGSQALRVDVADGASTLSELGDVLQLVLKRYQDTGYRARYPFLDLLQPLPADDSRVELLERLLIEQVLRVPHQNVGIAYPDSPAESDPTTELQYRITGDRRRQPGTRAEIDLNWVHARVRGAGPDPLRRLKVRPYDPDGNPRGPARPVRDYLTAEIELPDEQRYVLACGYWFHIDADTLALIERRLDRIGEALDLPLPPWQLGEDEGSYNGRVAAATGWINMERHRTTLADRHGHIEVCDLLTRRYEFICVKKLRASATLSHLFSQGSVSARLFAGRSRLYGRAQTYQEFIRGLHARRWPNEPQRTPTVVYAVGTDRSGRLRDLLPFFSRVNLAGHAELLDAFGFDVRMAKIEIRQFALPEARTPEARGGIPRQQARADEQPVQTELFET